jgi:tRNA threonylcarbamoyladenosine modification (KEOPS) complex Cgi121 subunit
MIEKFNINKKSYFIKNIYCSIDINNIENYLKRTESINYPIIIVYAKKNYLKQLNHSIYIAVNKFEENINISKKLWIEVLLTLSCTDQINNISKNLFLKKGNNQYIVSIISNKLLNTKQIKDIKHKLNIKEKKIKLKETKNIKKKIEEMATSYLKN